MVLGGGAEEGGAADVDVLEGVLEGHAGLGDGGLEGVEVDGDEVDGLQAAEGELGGVVGEVAAGEDAGVDGGVEGFHPAVEHLGEAGEVGDLLDGEAGVGEDAVGRAGADEVHAEVVEGAGKLGRAGLVVDAQERLHALSSGAELDGGVAVAGHDLADGDGVGDGGADRRDGVGGDDEDHADAHVEDAVHLGVLDAAALLDEAEDGGDVPRVEVDSGGDAVRQAAGDVALEAAAGDVGHALQAPQHGREERVVGAVGRRGGRRRGWRQAGGRARGGRGVVRQAHHERGVGCRRGRRCGGRGRSRWCGGRWRGGRGARRRGGWRRRR